MIERSLLLIILLLEIKHKDGSVDTSEARLDMQKIMQKHAGVFREVKLMEEGVELMNNLKEKIDKVDVGDKSDEFNTDFIERLELGNLYQNALATMESANFRRESRGAHTVEEFPERDDTDWLVHTLARMDDNEKIELSTRDVIKTTLTDEVEPVPLAKRVY